MAGIVLIEDNLQHRLYLRAVLEAHEFHVRPLPDGSWLLAALEIEPADLIIVDLYMPHMDGIEAVRAVRKKFPLVPIIGMSETNMDDPSVRALKRLGADVVVRKPLDEPTFVNLIRHLIPPQITKAA